MTYIKVSKTKSGATSVQLAKQVFGRTIILKHFGSAHNQQELQELKQQAQDFIISPGQLDMFTAPIDHHRIRTISHKPQYFEELIRHYYENKLKFNKLANSILFDLIMIRIYEPCSKLRSVRLLNERFNREYSVEPVYRLVTSLGGDKTSPKKQLMNLLKQAHDNYYGGIINILLYDVTTLYFESARAGDEYKVPGYSKDGKHKDPQILVGLLTNAEGFPLGYEDFLGNTFEGHTLLSVLNNWKQQFKGSKLRVLADAGMLSKINCEGLNEADYEFIVGARIHSLTSNLTKQVKSITKRDKRTQEYKYAGWRLIVQYSTKRAKKDLYSIKKAITKAQAIVDGKQTLKRRSKFVIMDEPSKTAKSLNQLAIDESRALAGLKGYITNIAEYNETSQAIIAYYHELWHVEKSFRMSKNDLRARPAFHHHTETIKGHLLIVVMALAVSKLIEKEMNQSIKSMVEVLANILSYQQQDQATKQTWWQHPLDTENTLISKINSLTGVSLNQKD